VYQAVGTLTTGTLAITHSQTPASGRYALFGMVQWEMPVNSTGRTPYQSGTFSSNTGSGTTGTVSITPSGNGGTRHWAAFVHATAEVGTPDSTDWTWAELHDASTTSIALHVEHIAAGGVDETATYTWATSSAWLGAIWEQKSPLYNAQYVDIPIYAVGGEVDGEGPAGSPSGVWATIN
jgi:hypothetical protein